MDVFEGHRAVTRRLAAPCIAIGNFDGVHLGHRALLDAARRRAAEHGGTPIALTFDPHPTAVLAPQEVEGLFGILRRMREEGKTVVIITHKLSEVLAISDEVTVMRDGRVIGSVATKSTSAAELARMMVGREVLLRVDKPAAR